MWNANFLHLNLRPLQKHVMKTMVQYVLLLGLFLSLSWPRLSFGARHDSPINKYSFQETRHCQNDAFLLGEDSFGFDESAPIRKGKLSIYPTPFDSKQIRLKLIGYNLHNSDCCYSLSSRLSLSSYLSLRVLRL